MPTVRAIAEFLEQLAPSSLAEEWDNVGLLVGDRQAQVARAMTCLTITPASAAEAVAEQADLVVAHHPLPFRPLKRLTRDTTSGRLLLDLIAGGVAVYSAHTAFDSAAAGINGQLAARLELNDVAPLVPAADDGFAPGIGTGRIGQLTKPTTLDALAARVKQLFALDGLHVVGDPQRPVERIAIACGSAGELLEAAIAAGADAFLTGEARFHTALEAEAQGIGLLLAGHYATERCGVESLAQMLAERFTNVQVWASRREADPLRWI